MTSFSASTLIDRARKLGNYENSGVFTDEFLLPWVSAAHGDYCDMLDAEWEGYRDTSTTSTTVAGTATLAMPNGLHKLRGLHVQRDGVYYALERFEPSRQVLGYDLATGAPRGYLEVGTSIEFFPTPDAAYTVRWRYVPAATAITSLSDTIDVPNGWEEFHILSICLRCDEREERSLTDRFAALDRVRARVRVAASQRNTAGPRYVPFPREGGGWR